MDKTYRTKLRRAFLIKGLPEPLSPASSHLQIFDNYIENTRMRLHYVRVPAENTWTYRLQQMFPVNREDLSVWKFSEIYLNEAEHSAFVPFEGREIRKNRYFFEIDDRVAELDIYLGKLWGLEMMTVEFDSKDQMQEFALPEFVYFEVSNSGFFNGECLVDKTFAEVQAEFDKLVTGESG